MEVRGRRYLILCWFVCLISLLGGSVSASARTRHHHRARHHRHHRRHHRVANRTSVLPYMGPAPSPTVFGINTLGYVSSSANFQGELPTARRMGARWVHFTNASVHFSHGGQPNWGVLDYEVKAARRLGLGVLVSLGGTPRACSVRGTTNFTGCPPTTAGGLYAYSLFLRAELIRYRNVVQYWESWLEPNGSSYWRPGANPRQYAKLLRVQYQVFQQVNGQYHTDLKLLFGGPISFGTAPGSRGQIAVLPFVNAVLGYLHGAHVFDGIGLHAYRFPASANGPATLNWGPAAREWDYVRGLTFPAEGCTTTPWCQMTWPQELSAYEQEFRNHGYDQMPLWLTEFGWPGNANPSTAQFPSFDTQARYLTEAYDDVLNLPFVQAAFWFNLEDYQPGVASGDPTPFYHYGLLRYGFSPKPAASAYEQFVKAHPVR